jgi:DNA-directed RNA polymerase subunit RPC12/RpoP
VAQTKVSVPLDSDGFLRRRCPSCRREFKWLHNEASIEPADQRYGCPYCGARHEASSYLTQKQLKLVRAAAMGLALDLLESAGMDVSRGPEPSVGDEAPDLDTAVFECHPEEPIKVYAEWRRSGGLRCLVCGRHRERA